MKVTSRIAGALLALTTAFSLAACSTPPTAELVPDYPGYESVEALAAEANLIVEVTIGTSTDDVMLPAYEGDDPATNPFAGTGEEPDLEEGAVPTTVFNATVSTVYRGDVQAGETITIKQLGGTLNGTEFKVPGTTSLEEGQTLVLFLATYPNAAASILGGDAGAFTQNGDAYTSSGDVRLTLTTADLQAL